LGVRAFALLLGSVLSAEESATVRTWTDLEGRTLEAVFLEFENDDTIRIRRADDRTFSLPLSRLSKRDRDYLAALRRGAESPEHAEAEHAAAASTVPNRPGPLPEDVELDDVPMVTQHGNFCVPASATMIAGFHGVETDQDEVAQLSSEASVSNQGTSPRDMMRAMGKLGFDGRAMHWTAAEDFHQSALPAIRRALVEWGPVYISFKPGVFGTMGHGCVIVGYDHRREEMYFYNPWGNEFERSYEDVATEGRGVVLVLPPPSAPVATGDFIRQVERALPADPGGIARMKAALRDADLPHELVWCSRADARDDRRFAEDTARREGRKILELAFERNPAVLIPHSPDHAIENWYLVTRPPGGGARFMVRELTADGWGDPELKTLGRLTRHWTTRIEGPGAPETVYELPMFELRLPQ